MAPSSNADRESESATASAHSPEVTESLSPAPVARFSEALLSCRDALRRGPLNDAQESWREAIGALGEIARQEGVLPESLLVHLKKVLDDFEGLQASPGETAETPRSRIITLVIESYFKSR